MKDRVFEKAIKKQFEFDEDVAAVFDDMLERSVPFYSEAMTLSQQIAINALKDGGVLYDLGCSTATLLLNIERALNSEVTLIGIDNSKAMLQHAAKKLAIYNSGIALQEGDILEYAYERAVVIISNYTLQFIRPLQREKLVQKIANSLEDEGIFIFSEKIVSEDKKLNKELIDIYYEFKKEQGYSIYEIMQKREALENVLIPYSAKENIEMCCSNGFKRCEMIFRWANFATFVARK
ncbi:MAG: carboxy-S-adenosyl-L-methionine synthase CmoA [Campylobacterota bacterium]|nr:carboxy-S-adenosyl-L-methionine synthase CmoA [Campylobacterota bacterium]